MNDFEGENRLAWQKKWELACQGDTNAQQDIRDRLNTQSHPLLAGSLYTLLKDSRFIQIIKGNTYGGYEMHTKVPVFLLLQGNVHLQCINAEGDNQILTTQSGPGILQASEMQLRAHLGDGNLPLATLFEVQAIEDSLAVELSLKAVADARHDVEGGVSLREQGIMRKYMIIALKHITKMRWSGGAAPAGKFYLLSGRGCYYHVPSKLILAVYEQGYFNPQQYLPTSDIKLHLFQGAHLMLLQQEMLRDEAATAAQQKRQQHIAEIQSKYDQMTPQQRTQIQLKLCEKYGLNRAEVDRDILGIEKTVEKRAKSKNDFIQTSSSIKEKCGIRIRKSKKTG